jgi:5'-methylthioadenosine phosphorylase
MALGVIGGSGIYNLDIVKVLEEIEMDTPYGKPSGKLVRASVAESEFFFLPRHGVGHVLSPSEINYRANIYALKKLGVNTIISISAVGSLKEEIAPEDFVIPDQFIDWTKGLRKRTFFENGVVGHVSAANPVDKKLQERLVRACKEAGIKTHKDGSYICIEGPQFSSKAESHIYRSLGASVIGMTNVPEAYLAKEAGIAYSTVAMVTDYDCWRDTACTVEEIMKVLKDNYISAQKFVAKAIPDLVANPISFEAENKYAVITNKDLIGAQHKEALEVLLS